MSKSIVEKISCQNEGDASVCTSFTYEFIQQAKENPKGTENKAVAVEFAELLANRTYCLKWMSKVSPLIPEPILDYAYRNKSNDGEILQDLVGAANFDVDLSSLDIHFIAKALAEGLEPIHGGNESHYGISPSHLKLVRGRLKLFGIGLVLRKLARNAHEVLSTVDLSFAPPELIDFNEKSEVGPWSDVFQMSATLYAIALDEPPPTIVDRLQDPKKTFALIERKLDQREDMIASGLADAIKLGLALSRKKRPKNASEWLKLIDLAGVPSELPFKPEEEPQETKIDNVPNEAQERTESAPQEQAKDLAGDVDGDLEEVQLESELADRKKWRFASLAVVALLTGGLVLAVSVSNSDNIVAGEATVDAADASQLDQTIASGVIDEKDGTDDPAVEAIASGDAIDFFEEDRVWLMGDWVIDQDKNGCSTRINISESTEPGALSFRNADTGRQEKVEFKQESQDRIKTDQWIYERRSDKINMSSVENGTVKMMLSRCKQ